MQMLIFISNRVDSMPNVISELMKIGIKGATFLNCEGTLEILANSSSSELPAFFGGMRTLFDNGNYAQGKLMLAVMPDELIVPSKNVIESMCGDFDKPNTGILFTVPVMHFEGVTKN